MLYASGCPWLGDELISFARGTYESDKIILREKILTQHPTSSRSRDDSPIGRRGKTETYTIPYRVLALLELNIREMLLPQ